MSTSGHLVPQGNSAPHVQNSAQIEFSPQEARTPWSVLFPVESSCNSDDAILVCPFSGSFKSILNLNCLVECDLLRSALDLVHYSDTPLQVRWGLTLHIGYHWSHGLVINWRMYLGLKVT